MDDVGVEDVSADKYQVVAEPQFKQRHLIGGRVVAGDDRKLGAGGRQDSGVVVGHERELLEPVHHHQVALDLGDRPCLWENTRLVMCRSRGSDVLE
ncbi:hypothetical protein D9M70_552780 [compost metagenome]